MKVSEIFYSVQGEGGLTGIPSVFVRTSGCNLRCRWCDTQYAWGNEGQDLSIEDIVSHAEKFPTRFWVLTGGEPMLAAGIRDLAGCLVRMGRHVTIETAGTVAPQGISCSLASVSPKLGNSTPPDSAGVGWQERHEERRLQPDVLRAWIDEYPFQLKFVVSDEKDVREILTLIGELQRDIPPEKILLMPEGTDPGVLRDRAEMVVEVCRQYGFRFCNRLQVQLWGNTRGH